MATILPEGTEMGPSGLRARPRVRPTPWRTPILRQTPNRLVPYYSPTSPTSPDADPKPEWYRPGMFNDGGARPNFVPMSNTMNWKDIWNNFRFSSL